MVSIAPHYPDETPALPTPLDQGPTPVVPNGIGAESGSGPAADTSRALAPTSPPTTTAIEYPIGAPSGAAATPAPLPRISVRGGNMAMRVLSRVMQDLDILTGGTRAATYEEVAEHVARRIAIERELENAALKAMGRQSGLLGGPGTGPAPGHGASLANSPASRQPAIDHGSGDVDASSTASAGTPAAQAIPTTEARDEATLPSAQPENAAETGPAALPDALPSQGTFKGGKKGLGDWFQYTQSLAHSDGNPADAAGPIGSGYFRADETDIATAAAIAKDTIDGADRARDFMNSDLTISAQYFEQLAAIESPYKDRYSFIAQILDTKIALDTAALDQKLGQEGMAYAQFSGQVARQVSVPVDFVMTIKDVSDGTISPAEAAVNFATMGHGHQVESLERMVAKGAERQVAERAQQAAGGDGGSGTGGGGTGAGGKANGSDRGGGGGHGGGGTDGPSGESPRQPNRAIILQAVEETLRAHVPDIKKIDPDAAIGFRGGLASDMKGPHKKFAPFDPKDFDVDALIISDKLAREIKPVGDWRRGTHHRDIRRIQFSIEKSLRSNPIMVGLREDRFTFRVYSRKELADLIAKKTKQKDMSFKIRYITEYKCTDSQ